MRLATLALDIIEAIINGEEPNGEFEARPDRATPLVTKASIVDAERRKPRQWSLAKLVKNLSGKLEGREEPVWV